MVVHVSRAREATRPTARIPTPCATVCPHGVGTTALRVKNYFAITYHLFNKTSYTFVLEVHLDVRTRLHFICFQCGDSVCVCIKRPLTFAIFPIFFFIPIFQLFPIIFQL